MTDAIHIYVTATQIFARRQTGSWWKKNVESLGAWNWNAAVPSSLTFEPLHLQIKYRPRLHVYVGSALCKFMTVDLPKGLKDANEQHAAARAQMQHQLGLNASEWQFTIDSSITSNKATVCAIRHAVIERIQELSNENGLRLVSLTPYVVGVWNAFQKNIKDDTQNKTALVAIENDAFTIFVSRSGMLESMSTLAHESESLLVDRERKRLSFSFTEAEQKNIYFALSEKMLNTAQAYADRILRKDVYLKEASYTDFRDLLFCTEGKQ